MAKTEITIDKLLCTNCLRCEIACPTELFTVRRQTAHLKENGSCISCGHCVSVCNVAALSHSRLPKEMFAPVEEATATDEDTLVRLLKARRSCRRFLPKQIESDAIDELLTTSAYSPTSTNRQDVAFEILRNPSEIGELSSVTTDYYRGLARQISNPLIRPILNLSFGSQVVKKYEIRMPAILEMFQKVADGDDRLFYNAPTVIVVHGGGVPHFANANCNLAAMSILLHAQAKGLGTCLCGYATIALAKSKKNKERFGIKKSNTVGAVISIGHPHMDYHLIPPRAKRV